MSPRRPVGRRSRGSRRTRELGRMETTSMHIDGANSPVAGGAGPIGSTTIDLLLRKSSPLRIVIPDNLVRGALANVGRALIDPCVAFMHDDIRNSDTVRRATEGMNAVIHLASLGVTACAANTREAMGAMCDSRFNVVEAARAAGVKKMVAASSASVYELADTSQPAPRQRPGRGLRPVDGSCPDGPSANQDVSLYARLACGRRLGLDGSRALEPAAFGLRQAAMLGGYRPG